MKKVSKRRAKTLCCQQYYGHSEIYKVFMFVKLIMFDEKNLSNNCIKEIHLI